ncbi:MAG: type III-A CRISPR-associated protein Csm2 [Terriglobia bacterium]|jgi:CRISPR type III-A-associated protein Csm2
MADEKRYKSFSEMSPPPPGGGRKGRGDRGRRPDHQPAPPALSPEYLRDGYFDKEGHLRAEVFIEWPEKELKPKLNATKNSLRAFYTMLRMAKNQLEGWRGQPDKAREDAKNQLLRMRVGAEYQLTRKVISQVCHDFLVRNIDEVLKQVGSFENFAKNLNAFVEHFQAVIAYLPEKAER